MAYHRHDRFQGVQIYGRQASRGPNMNAHPPFPAANALQILLEHAYGDSELRTLAIGAFPDAPDIYASIPGTGASRRDLAATLVGLMRQHYGTPPKSFWAYLTRTRAHRLADISRLEQAIAAGLDTCPDEPASQQVEDDGPSGGSSDASPTVRVCSPRRGSLDVICHLSALGYAGRAPGARFPDLAAGRVNGVERSFVLTWTEQRLTLVVAPSLYASGGRMQTRFDVPLPAKQVLYDYYPRGIAHYPPGARDPLSYRFLIEAWNGSQRRLALIAADRVLTIEVTATEK